MPNPILDDRGGIAQAGVSTDILDTWGANAAETTGTAVAGLTKDIKKSVDIGTLRRFTKEGDFITDAFRTELDKRDQSEKSYQDEMLKADENAQTEPDYANNPVVKDFYGKMAREKLNSEQGILTDDALKTRQEKHLKDAIYAHPNLTSQFQSIAENIGGFGIIANDIRERLDAREGKGKGGSQVDMFQKAQLHALESGGYSPFDAPSKQLSDMRHFFTAQKNATDAKDQLQIDSLTGKDSTEAATSYVHSSIADWGVSSQNGYNKLLKSQFGINGMRGLYDAMTGGGMPEAKRMEIAVATRQYFSNFESDIINHVGEQLAGAKNQSDNPLSLNKIPQETLNNLIAPLHQIHEFILSNMNNRNMAQYAEDQQKQLLANAEGRIPADIRAFSSLMRNFGDTNSGRELANSITQGIDTPLQNWGKRYIATLGDSINASLGGTSKRYPTPAVGTNGKIDTNHPASLEDAAKAAGLPPDVAQRSLVNTISQLRQIIFHPTEVANEGVRPDDKTHALKMATVGLATGFFGLEDAQTKAAKGLPWTSKPVMNSYLSLVSEPGLQEAIRAQDPEVQNRLKLILKEAGFNITKGMRNALVSSNVGTEFNKGVSGVVGEGAGKNLPKTVTDTTQGIMPMEVQVPNFDRFSMGGEIFTLKHIGQGNVKWELAPRSVTDPKEAKVAQDRLGYLNREFAPELSSYFQAVANVNGAISGKKVDWNSEFETFKKDMFYVPEAKK